MGEMKTMTEGEMIGRHVVSSRTDEEVTVPNSPSLVRSWLEEGVRD